MANPPPPPATPTKKLNRHQGGKVGYNQKRLPGSSAQTWMCVRRHGKCQARSTRADGRISTRGGRETAASHETSTADVKRRVVSSPVEAAKGVSFIAPPQLRGSGRQGARVREDRRVSRLLHVFRAIGRNHGITNPTVTCTAARRGAPTAHRYTTTSVLFS